jgi:Protein of unknown function (DUF1552)
MTLHTHVLKRISRRKMNQATFATLLCAPFLVPDRRAHAARPVPKNLVLVTWPEGLEKGWEPTVANGQMTFPAFSSALNAHKNQLLAVRGLSSGYNIFTALTAHTSGPLSLWTGATSKGGDGGLKELPVLPSIDQLLAGRIGKDSQFRSLHFGAQTNRDSFISTPYVHFSGPKQPVPAEDDPNVMYRQIFQSAGQSTAELEKIRKRKASVLDFVKRQLNGVKPKVPAADRIKMEQHEQAIRELEKRLDGLGNTCAAVVNSKQLSKEAAMADANFKTVIELQSDLMVAALQCQLTKVVTLQMSNTDSSTKISNIATQRGVHEAQHSGTYEDRVAVGKFFVEQLAYVLGRLKSVDVGNGRTLLDDTLVVMGSDMAIGTHAPDPAAFFLAGATGTIRAGTYVDVAASKPQHTQLLAAVMQAMGAGDVTNIGDFPDANAKGVLPGVLL